MDSANAATRLLEVLQRAKDLKPPNSAKAYSAWATIFEDMPDDPAQKASTYIAISRKLLLMDEQLDSIQTRLRLMDRQVQLAGVVNRLGRLFNPAHLNAQWNKNHREWLDESVFVALKLWEVILDDGEVRIEDEELAAGIEQIEELLNRIRQSDLRDELKLFLINRLEEAARGLHDYPIQGAKALWDALRDIDFHHRGHDDLWESNESTPEEEDIKQSYYSVLLFILEWMGHTSTAYQLSGPAIAYITGQGS